MFSLFQTRGEFEEKLVSDDDVYVHIHSHVECNGMEGRKEEELFTR